MNHQRNKCILFRERLDFQISKGTKISNDLIENSLNKKNCYDVKGEFDKKRKHNNGSPFGSTSSRFWMPSISEK